MQHAPTYMLKVGAGVAVGRVTACGGGTANKQLPGETANQKSEGGVLLKLLCAVGLPGRRQYAFGLVRCLA